MKLFSDAKSSPVLLAAAIAVAATVIACITTIAKDHRQQQQQQQHELLLSEQTTQSRSNHSFPSGFRCNLFLKDIEYEPTEEQPLGYSDDVWFCELSPEVASAILEGVVPPVEEKQKHYNYNYLDIASNSTAVIDSQHAIPGRSVLVASQAFVDVEEGRLYLPSEALVSVEKRTDNGYYYDSSSSDNNSNNNTFDYSRRHERRRRNLAPTSGTLQALVIRVTDSQGKAPEPTATQLREDVFRDDVSLSTGYDACSFGKLAIEPYNGMAPEKNVAIENGVYELEVDYDVTAEGATTGGLQQAAFDKTDEVLGDLRAQFGLVLFCFPPGTGGWLAYAFSNDQISFYNDKWCTYVSALLHEVGHNLG